MKRLFLLSLILLLASWAAADVYTIGTGTTAAYYSPFCGLYNYSWSKVIYTRAEINAAGLNSAANILGVGFNVGNTPANYTMLNQKVYVRHSTLNSYETTNNNYPGTDGFQLAFQGDLTYNGSGWHYISFSAPFAWNGTQNIEFLFENWDGAWVTGYPTFNYTATPSTMTYYKILDANFPSDQVGTATANRPNIQLFTPQTTPPVPAQAVFPLNGATQVSPGLTLRWVPVSGFPDGYKISLGTNNPPTNILNNVNIQNVTSYNPDPDLLYNTVYYWKIVPYNQFGDAANCPVWSFTTHGDGTITQLPYIQNFDSVTTPNLPFDWFSIISGTGAVVESNVTTPVSAPNCVRIYNGSVATNEAVLIAPQLAQNISANTVRMKLMVKGGAANYSFKFGVMTNPNDINTFTEIQSISPTTTWLEYVIPFNSYTGTGRYLAIRHGQGGTGRTFYIDNVTIELIAANDLACTSVTGNSTPTVNTPVTHTLSVFNWGTNPQSTYTVKLFNSANQELGSAAGVTCAPGATVQIPITWTPATAGPNAVYGKVILTGDQNSSNDQSPPLNLNVVPAGNFMITVGDGSQTIRMPLDFYYKNSFNQTLYFQDELGSFGNINAITLYNQFTTATLQDKPIKVWIGTTTLQDLSAGWVPVSQMTMVYDGTANFPGGQNEILIPLQVPFSYSGGNIIVAFKRMMDSAYFSSTDYFKGQTVGTNRARNIYSDSVDYDPEAPSAVGTLTGQFAKTSFLFTPLSNDPIFSIVPTSYNYGTVLLDTSRDKIFRISNAGGGTLTINSITIAGSPMFSLQNMPTLPASLATGQSITFVGRYHPTAAGTQNATITVTDNLARTTHTVAITGTCIDTNVTSLPYIQHFDTVATPNLPPDWDKLITPGGTSTVIETYTTTPNSAPNCVRIYNGSPASPNTILIAPPLAQSIPVNTTRLKVWVKGVGAAYILSVGVMSNPTDPSTYTEIQNFATPTVWTEFIVPLNGYTGTGRYIAIKHGNTAAGQTIYIDDVTIELIAANDLACSAISGNTTPGVNTPTTYSASIFNWGTQSQSTYTVKLFNAAGTELASSPGVTVAPGQTVQVPLSWTPTTEGPVTIYGKVVLASDQNSANDQSPPLSITVMPAGINVITIGDGSQNIRMPLDFFYKNSLNQTIYFFNEINTFGSITAITLYNQFTSTTLQNKPIKVWLGSTNLDNLSAGWIPSTQMTLVYDGTINFPSGANNITIPLQTPFTYTSGNLAVLFKRPMDTAYFSSTDYFKGQTIGTNRARNIYSDSVDYDPANPGTVGTVSGQCPKISFSIVSDGMASLTGTVSSGATPLQGVQIRVQGTTFQQITGANGTYNFPFILPGAYTVVASKVGYETQSQNVTLVADQTTTLNFNMPASQVVNVTGHLVGSDAPTIGLSGAEVTLIGPLTHTGVSNAQGNFTVTGVLSGNTYNYTISKVGYANLTGTINVGNTDYNMGNLTMNEQAAPPRLVTASLTPNNQLKITWMPPGSSGGGGPMEDFEITDGGWVPTATWNPIGDWEWTNTYDVANWAPVYTGTNVVPPPTAHSGTGMWGTKINTNYTNSGGFNNLTKTFNFSGITNPQLRFWSWENVFGDFDYCQVKVNNALVWGPSWDYTGTQWRERIIDLSGYGGQANVEIQFQMWATTTVNYAGWYIDDVYAGPAIGYQPSAPAPQISSNFRGLSEIDAAVLADQIAQSSPCSQILNSFSASQQPRALVGYKVWRLTQGNESNPNTWISLTATTITDTTLIDPAWATLPDAVYKWAVKGIYSNNLEGPAAFSNPMTILRNDLAALSIQGNITPSVGSPSNYTVRVKNVGTDPQQATAYTVKLMSGTTELASVPGVTLAPNATHDFVISWVPATAGAMTIFGKVTLPGDTIPTNDNTNNLNLLVQAPGILAFTVGEGTATARIPIDMYYKCSLHQYIIYPAEISNTIGTINGLALYNNFTQDLMDKPIQIWIGTTTLPDLSGGWIPVTGQTQVFNGTLNFQTGQNTITIPFNNPYLYLDGANIVLTFKRPLDTAYFNSTNYFKAQTGTPATRARNVYSDTVDYDPTAPQAAGTASGQFAQTTFFIIPGGVGHLNGTVTGVNNQPIAGARIQFATGGYQATTNAQGAYNIQNILPNTYTVTFSAYGYISQTQTVVIEEDETETLNVTLQPMPTVSVTGTILASDTGAGIPGASVLLNGYANYSGNSIANGSFTIPSVYANQSYTYVISAPGYTSQNGTINVGATNHNMGSITLTEVAFAPIGVVAEANVTNSVVTVSWLAPDPNALEITESFENETFPPAEWTRTITNNGAPNAQGVYPTWCRVGSVNIGGEYVNPSQGNSQAGLFWDYNHQDEWLITPSFNCPPSAYLRFDSYVFLGSTNQDHYYVKLTNNNGNTWTVLWDASAQTGGWNHYASPININLTPYSGQQIKLAFQAVDGDNGGLWYVWFIDNIYIGNTITNIRFAADQLVSRSNGSRADVTADVSFGTSDRAASRAVELGYLKTEPRLPFPTEIRSMDGSTRSLIGYKVYRLASGQEGNESSWTVITPQMITGLQAEDSSWGSLPNGNYRWAVKAVYTADVTSVPSFSNVLQKMAQTGMIAGVVRNQAGNVPIMGVTVTAAGVTATTNTAGAYTLIVPVGTHSVTASKQGFITQTIQNVVVGLNQTTTVNFLLVAGSENEDEIIPVTATAYHGNFPNPFNPETTLSYSIKEAGDVKIEVYNLKGQLVRSLVNQAQASGHYSVVFDGRDLRGNQLSSGVYFVRMQAPGYHNTNRMLMMK